MTKSLTKIEIKHIKMKSEYYKQYLNDAKITAIQTPRALEKD